MPHLPLKSILPVHAGLSPAAGTGVSPAEPGVLQEFQALLQGLMLPVAATPPGAPDETMTENRKPGGGKEENALSQSCGMAADTPLAGLGLPVGLSANAPAAPPADPSLAATTGATEGTPGTTAEDDAATRAAAMATSRPHALNSAMASVPAADAEGRATENSSRSSLVPSSSFALPEGTTRRATDIFSDAQAHAERTAVPRQDLDTLLEQRGVAAPAHGTAFAHALEAAHAPASANARIDTPVTSPQWSNEFTQRVVWLAGDKQQAAELHVNPPELGPVSIRLDMDERQTSAVFSSPHAEIREIIEAALPRLREVLADSGITLGNASVTSESPRDGAAFDRQREPTRQPTYAHAAGTDTSPDAARTLTPLPARGNGLVDLFA